MAAARVHWMDNLRALAMLAGVVFHAALAYSPMLRPVWPLADADGSVMVDAFVWFLHLFRMPLFFVVAGYFSALIIERRGMAGLFRQRVRRVLLPLLVGTPIVLVTLQRLTEHAVATVVHPSPLLAWLQRYAAEHGGVPFLPGWAHLWFLCYLLLCTLMLWVVTTLELRPLQRLWQALPAWSVPIVLPLLLIAPLASVHVPWPAPEALVPQLWAMVCFGLFLGLGVLVRQRPQRLDGWRRIAPLLFAGAVLAYAAMPWMFGASFESFPLLLLATLESFASAWLTLCCLVAGKRWLDRGTPWLRWLADASYWVYLVHLPLLFAIQYALLDVTALHWIAKFAVATGATLLLSFASYQLLVRHTVLGRWLGGPAPSVTTGTLAASARAD